MISLRVMACSLVERIAFALSWEASCMKWRIARIFDVRLVADVRVFDAHRNDTWYFFDYRFERPMLESIERSGRRTDVEVGVWLVQPL